MADEIDEIKQRLDVVSYIGRFVALERAGASFKGLCPFHAEKTPSFFVSPSHQRWHCFGQCATGGSLIDFAMRYQGWDFGKALEELAREAGVTLRRRAPTAGPRPRLLAANTAAATVYHQHLLATPAVQAYLAGRGIRPETWRAWEIGFCGSGVDVQAALTPQGYTPAELAEAGILRAPETAGDRYRQRFWGRITFPIRDEGGAVIGFGARVFADGGGHGNVAKFINSPQTPVFDKGKQLFGLYEARDTIRARNEAVVVEGYLDVIACHQAGERNVVASMGTALTPDQAKRLRKYARRIVIALDPDPAGVQGAERGLAVLAAAFTVPMPTWFDLQRDEHVLDADLRVVALPAGQDPDDLALADPAEWRRLIGAAQGIIDHHLSLVGQLDVKLNGKDKAVFAQRILPLLRTIPDPIEREDAVQQLARTLDVPIPIIRDLVAKRPAAKPAPPRPPTTPPPSGTLAAELGLLYLVAACPRVLDRPEGPLAEDFGDPLCRAAFTDLVAGTTVQHWATPEEALPLVGEPQRARLAEALAQPVPATEYQFAWLWQTLRLARLTADHEQAVAAVQELLAAGASAEARALHDQAVALARTIATCRGQLGALAVASAVVPLGEADTVAAG